MASEKDGLGRRGRVLGSSDFFMNMGTLNHRGLIRDNHLVDRVELSQEMVLGVLLDILKGLQEERFVTCGAYRILRLPHTPLMLTHLECKNFS